MFNDFMSDLETAYILFNMYDVDTGLLKIKNARGYITAKEKNSLNTETEYYVFYKFSEEDTKKSGNFKGEFIISLPEMGNLVVPIQEELNIVISPSVDSCG